MLNNKRICVVVPAYNEGTQIAKVLDSMPDYVDKIVVVNDKSTDNTGEIITTYSANHERIHFIDHKKNQGVGGSIASGYIWARDNGYDTAVVMAGDGQMDPEDLESIVRPVIEGKVDYCKGNRLITGEAYQKIPKIRYFGNAILSMLTKIASGYWHIADSQSGYAAISKRALKLINWNLMYKRYGQPNDILVRLNVYGMSVRDIPINPLYNIGEKSGIKIWKVVFTISFLLLRLFVWRMKEKYIIRDFHPLIFFYSLAVFLFSMGFGFFIRLIHGWHQAGFVPKMTFFSLFFSIVLGMQTLFFAMWFDMENNKNLK